MLDRDDDDSDHWLVDLRIKNNHTWQLIILAGDPYRKFSISSAFQRCSLLRCTLYQTLVRLAARRVQEWRCQLFPASSLLHISRSPFHHPSRRQCHTRDPHHRYQIRPLLCRFSARIFFFCSGQQFDFKSHSTSFTHHHASKPVGHHHHHQTETHHFYQRQKTNHFIIIHHETHFNLPDDHSSRPDKSNDSSSP